MAGTIASDPDQYLKALSELSRSLDRKSICGFADLLFEAWRLDRMVIVFGNGGSAYTSSHHVTDYVKTAGVHGRRRLRAISLVDNFGLTTAIGNDITYEQVFSHSLESYARPGDLAVALSCSGSSPNVLAACRMAKATQMQLVGLTGFAGGKLGEMCDVHINVPSENYGLIEDLHLSIGHIAAQMLHARITASPEVQ